MNTNNRCRPYTLWNLILDFPRGNWILKCVMQNPQITIDNIREMLNRRSSKVLDYSDYSDYLNYSDYSDYLDYVDYSDLDFVDRLNCLDHSKRWEYISQNPNITMEFIIEHLDKPWNWGLLSENKNINMDFVRKHSNKRWNWDYISVNPIVTMDYVTKNPKHPWRWDFFKKNFNKPWSWYDISMHPNITMDIIKANQFLVDPARGKIPVRWDKQGILRNPNITPNEFGPDSLLNFNITELIDYNVSILIDYVKTIPQSITIALLDIIHRSNIYNMNHFATIMLYNRNLSWDIISKYLNKCRNYEFILSYPNITPEMIKSHNLLITSNFAYEMFSLNPNITPSFVRNNTNIEWNFACLSQNPMDQPYYNSAAHKEILATHMANAIRDELTSRVCHPSRHPANYIALNDLENHPFMNLTQTEIDEL